MKKPQSYYCHRYNQSSSNIPKKYSIINKIGEGAFGQVYKVFNHETSNIEVIKKTKENENSSELIQRETQIMSQMQNSDGFAKVKNHEKENGCFAMTLLGKNLEQITANSGICLIDMKRIAYQCILRLKQLHEKGYVHRDLKPENILMGNQNHPHKIYLVDFGLSSNYKKSSKIARKVYTGQIGTVKYCPIASHYGLQQYPKDDLESLGYILIYISTKKLAWSGMSRDLSQSEKYEIIKQKKQKTQLQVLCQGIGCIKKYFKAIKAYKIGDQIDYNLLLDNFKIECKQIYCFKFCRQDCFARLKGQEQQQNKDECISNEFGKNLQQKVKKMNVIFLNNKSKY